MGNMSEIDALKAIDHAFSGLEDPDARNRVLTWAWEKFSSKPAPNADDNKDPSVVVSKAKKSKKKVSGAKGKVKVNAKPSLAIVKDLNLRPKGKKSLDEFAEIKKPSSHYEKCSVSVYYLKNELNILAITESHVYTCYKHMKWRNPADISNTLAYTASHYGWLDTSNLQDIKLTPIGENLVEQDLPKKKGHKKS
jgi:hypothetical protein